MAHRSPRRCALHSPFNRPDKVIPALTLFVAEQLGRRFVEPLPFAIEPSFNDSSATTPLIFVLSPGSDPMSSLQSFSDDKNIAMKAVSLGQGQGPIAQRLIEQVRSMFGKRISNNKQRQT
jgi:dynein heavy chain